MFKVVKINPEICSKFWRYGSSRVKRTFKIVPQILNVCLKFFKLFSALGKLCYRLNIVMLYIRFTQNVFVRVFLIHQCICLYRAFCCPVSDLSSVYKNNPLRYRLSWHQGASPENWFSRKKTYVNWLMNQGFFLHFPIFRVKNV